MNKTGFGQQYIIPEGWPLSASIPRLRAYICNHPHVHAASRHHTLVVVEMSIC